MVSRDIHIKEKTFKKLFEDIILQELPPKKEDIAVLYSGGVDSSSCLFSLLELGYTPVLYSFHLDNYISDDYKSAKYVSELFNLKFNEVIVPTNNIRSDFLTLIKEYHCSKKTELECSFPWLYVFPEIKENYVITGLCADEHYGLSKSAMIRYKSPKQVFDEFRKKRFKSDNPSGIKQIRKIAGKHSKKIIIPYYSKRIQDYFLYFSWEDINKPYQKYLVISNYFKYYQKTGRRTHSDLQINSHVPPLFSELLSDKKFNFKDRKRTIDLVRDYYKKYYGGKNGV